ncbi:GRAM domain-containing protein 2A-like isoform X1 [Chelonus insularis]|uniref:GRAM domain-containing protein 2A-like isoform X1 n=2 Tax=Chelonus insularis TaxID=460826 RepID=UPI00158A71D4|nr:GRAM domain-containing protein 2A-like isoform X1 [Chelonus insularis]XP_034943917.1 GRAM domain-containing protein 2A-like isoform X1 [Chelonus insularis]
MEYPLYRSSGSIRNRSASNTPIQKTVGYDQQSQQTRPSPINEQPPNIRSTVNNFSSLKSPSHEGLNKCSDSQLLKPLSRSTPSMTGGSIQSPTVIRRSSTRSSPSTSSARQKKFNRHFTQVAPDERVLNYYSCALVGDILLQGHLYITSNYFAFYSNVFGYVTKLLIPIISVHKISKEKTARIIPNAIAVVTEEERHVFCSLLSRDSTFKLMIQVWDSALEGKQAVSNVSLPVEVKLLPDTLLIDDSEANIEEDDSSMSESGTDLTSRPPTICTDTDSVTPISLRPMPASLRFDHNISPKNFSNKKLEKIRSFWWFRLRSSTIMILLVGLLAALYISAAFMMIRIDKLHTTYLNHPLTSPERFTHDQFLQYINRNLEQIIRIRQSLQILSQQFVQTKQDDVAYHGVEKSKLKSTDVFN